MVKSLLSCYFFKVCHFKTIFKFIYLLLNIHAPVSFVLHNIVASKDAFSLKVFLNSSISSDSKISVELLLRFPIKTQSHGSLSIDNVNANCFFLIN